MSLNPRSAVHSIAVEGRHLARLVIDVRDTDTPDEDMHALAQKLRSLADTIDKETR